MGAQAACFSSRSRLAAMSRGSPGPAVHVVNGIQYPRHVPAPEGVPEGWTGVEQVFGPNSKLAGKTYIRYKSLDGRHKAVPGVKQIFMKHCEDKGIPWEPEFAAWEANKEAKKQAQKDELGVCDPAERESMIALSRAKFGELTGPICLGFPGWKCRWDYLPESGQAPKTFIAADGREWKILKELESFIGVRLSGGGQKAEDITAMVEAGLVNYSAHDLFKAGSRRALESQGSYLLDPAAPDEEHLETMEERAKRVAERKVEMGKRRRMSSRPEDKNSLYRFGLEVVPAQEGWAALASAADVPQALVQFKSLLLKRGFQDDLELVAVLGGAEACKYAPRLKGIYYRMPTKISARSCYQKLLRSAGSRDEICCDGVYMWWCDSERQWQISVSPSVDAACIAYCKDDKELVTDVSQSWEVQREGTGDFQADDSLKILRDTK